MRSRSWTGMGTMYGPDGETHRDTFTCVHCNSIRHVKPFADFNSCKKCFGPVCEGCYGGDCVPIEKWLEAQERPSLRRKLLGF
jgi:hypothetical protein